MNQDDFLERLWNEVIDVAHRPISLQSASTVRDQGLAILARYARYCAVFDWCFAHDEEERGVTVWLRRKPTHARWRELLRWSAESVREPPRIDDLDEPFADAIQVWRQLLETGVPPALLAAFLQDHAGSALEALRSILQELADRDPKIGTDDLAGLHESLLSADPSGREGRPGGPRPKSADSTEDARSPSLQGPTPLLRLKRASEFAFSPDRTRAVASSGAIVDLASGRTIAKCAVLANTSHIAWSPDGRVIVGTSTSGKIALFDPESGERLHVLSRKHEGAAPIFSQDGRVLFVVDREELFAWSLETVRPVAKSKLPGVQVSELERLSGEEQMIALVFHPPSSPNEPPLRELVGLDAALQETGPRVRLTGDIRHVMLDPRDRNRALAAGYDWLAWLDVRTGVLSEPHTIAPLHHVALSPDGRHVAAATFRGFFRVSASDDLTRGKDIQRQYAFRVGFSRDGSLITLSTYEAGEVWELSRLLASSDR